MAALKALALAVEAEVEEFKCFANEFRRGVDEWKTCVFNAEYSAEKIRDHYLNDPMRMSSAKAESDLRILQATQSSVYFASLQKFLLNLDKKANSLEKFDKKLFNKL